MKRFSILILVFVLTAALMTGCGCTGPSTEESKAPTVLPTNEEVPPTTRETTSPTTEATTQPSSAATEPSETIDRGNGPLEDVLPDTTETTGANGNGSTGRSMTRG